MRPIRRVVVEVIISVDVVVVPPTTTGVPVPPTTTGAPVTPGVALPVGLVTAGIGAGTAVLVPGVTIIGLVLNAALVVSVGLVFLARRRARSPIRRGVVVNVLTTVVVGTPLATTGGAVPVGRGEATGGSAVAEAANRKPIAAANKNRFIDASS
jgi:hypothetical protein